MGRQRGPQAMALGRCFGENLARALQKLDDEGLVISDGLLVRASRPALYFKHLIGSVAIDVHGSAI